ncbi:type II toxin-antitoxin system HicA family toxin [Lamprobacter sp.]|uniref:type II toxin-antitoxin system HicA family toxin n=1 Tax=Lamprobacter sp. TaxID=3100796 RepID=UPI002B25D178|nr:type II toxin-antitoxin system HicA family toxin [Lamprobacter sp.]
MKRGKLIQLLRRNGCELVREGNRHSIWKNIANSELTAVPRHSEIKDLMAHKKANDHPILTTCEEKSKALQNL